MGIRDWFAKKPTGPDAVSAPSAEYPSPRSAIEAILRAYPDLGDDEDWISFKAENAAKKATVEVAGDQINFCKQEVDLAAMLSAAGLSALAESVSAGGRKQNDLTLWTATNPTLDELIEIVAFSFSNALGFGDSYKLYAEHMR